MAKLKAAARAEILKLKKQSDQQEKQLQALKEQLSQADTAVRIVGETSPKAATQTREGGRGPQGQKALQTQQAQQENLLLEALEQTKLQLKRSEELRAAAAKAVSDGDAGRQAAVREAVKRIEDELEETKTAHALELRRAREDLSAVRARARQLAEEKEGELSRLRAATKVSGGGSDAGGTSGAGVASRSSSSASLGQLTTASAAPSGVVPLEAGRCEDSTAAAAESGSSGASHGANEGSGGGETTVAALSLAARLQAGRDAETAGLRQRNAMLEQSLRQATADAKHYAVEAAEQRRAAARSQAGEAAGFLKDVLFKYLVASEEQKLTIFPLLANVVQFSKPELEHLRRVEEHKTATTTASGILSSIFFAPAPPEQDSSFADPSAAAETANSAGTTEQREADGEESVDALADWLLTPAARRAEREGPSRVSATPLQAPFSVASTRTDDQEDPAELKHKLARMKKLLAAANAHIERFKAREVNTRAT